MTTAARMPSTELATLEEVTRMLGECRTVRDAKKIRDLAEAARVYAKRAGLGLEAQNHAAEIKLGAEYRAGEILIEMEAKGERVRAHGGAAKSSSAVQLDSEELPITKTQSSRWQKVATYVKPAALREYIAAKKADHVEVTSIGLARIAKENERETKRDANRDLISRHPIKAVAGAERYQTIVLDPPWDFGDEGDWDPYGRARPTYGQMPIEEIAALPVGDMATDNAHIYLWITNRSLPKGFALLDGWGFRYLTAITWVKPSFGMGNYFRGQTEHVLFGLRGSLPLLRQDAGTVIQAPRPKRHSEKPSAFYELVETCSPGPWLELFSRSERPGWVTRGAEVPVG